MSRVIHKCLESKQTDSKLSKWCLIQTGQNHRVTTKVQKDMAIVKQAEKQVKYRQKIYAYE